jgi:hypothetical protein
VNRPEALDGIVAGSLKARYDTISTIAPSTTLTVIQFRIMLLC